MEENNLPKSKRRKLNNVADVFEEKIEVNKKSYDDVLYQLIIDLEQQSDTYLNVPVIIEGFKKLIEENSEGTINRCTVCQTDMGRQNPRQLCGKTRCLSE